MVNISYRRIKNINIYVKPPDGHILVTAPIGMQEQKILDFVLSKREWIEKARERVVQRSEDKVYETVSPLQREDLLHRTYELAAYWEPLMGVHANKFTIRKMKSRWGSCTVSTGNIRINEWLALLPESSLEYIVVHELCHLLEPSHNSRFKALMSKFMPDWKSRQEQLKAVSF